MISVMAQGRLVIDVAVRTLANGSEMATTTIAVQCPDPRNAEIEPSMLINVVAFGSLATELADFRRGDVVAVSGALQRSHFEKNGEAQMRFGILADSVAGARGSRERARRRRSEAQV